MQIGVLSLLMVKALPLAGLAVGFFVRPASGGDIGFGGIKSSPEIL